MKCFILISSLLFTGIVGNARAAVIYDFESPYTLGNLVGQQGWTSGVAGTDANVVNPGIPAFGSQYASVAGDGVTFGSEGLITNTLAGSGFADITVISLQTALSTLGQSYGEIWLRDSSNVTYAQVGIQNPGYYVYDSPTTYVQLLTPVATNTVFDVEITLNFSTQMYRTTFSTSSVITYDSGFVTLMTAMTTAAAGAGNIQLRGGYFNNAFNGKAYFDNIGVMAVPEPSSVVLLSLGGLLLLWRSRRGGHSHPNAV